MALQLFFNPFDEDDFFGYPVTFSRFSKELDSFLDVPKSSLTSNIGACNIKESETDYELDFHVPGFHKEDISIDLEDNTLIVKGEYKQENQEEDKEKKYHRKEVSYSSLSRKFILPDNVDVSNIGASLDQGILKVKISKKPVQEPEKINIPIQ